LRFMLEKIGNVSLQAFSTANYKLVVINQGVGPVYFELDFNFVRRFPTHPPSPTFI
jgi:hypothetical protein